jgi:hypothetical protein
MIPCPPPKHVTSQCCTRLKTYKNDHHFSSEPAHQPCLAAGPAAGGVCSGWRTFGEYIAVAEALGRACSCLTRQRLISGVAVSPSRPSPQAAGLGSGSRQRALSTKASQCRDCSEELKPVQLTSQVRVRACGDGRGVGGRRSASSVHVLRVGCIKRQPFPQTLYMFVPQQPQPKTLPFGLHWCTSCSVRQWFRGLFGHAASARARRTPTFGAVPLCRLSHVLLVHTLTCPPQRTNNTTSITTTDAAV